MAARKRKNSDPSGGGAAPRRKVQRSMSIAALSAGQPPPSPGSLVAPAGHSQQPATAPMAGATELTGGWDAWVEQYT